MANPNPPGTTNPVRELDQITRVMARENALALPYAVEVDLASGKDYTVRFTSIEEANGAVVSIFKSGYSIEAREQGGLLYHPVHTIKAITIRTKEVLDVRGGPGPNLR